MAARLVTVFGGSGFLGRHLVRRLAQSGARVRVAVRDVEAANFLKPMGDVGQIVPVQANLRHGPSVARAVERAQAVVNLVGILYQFGPQRFAAVHAQGAGRVAGAAAEAGAERFVQVSAIGADADSPAEYARSKAAGEVAVREAYPEATIVRPSVIFGPEDGFFNRFAALARLTPVLPLIGGGETRFQPVYVGDVAAALMRILDDPDTAGQTFELGGPAIYSLRQVMELVLEQIGRERLLLAVPFPLAMLKARFLELLPVPPLTRDQVKLLMRDSVVAEGARTLEDLGLTPTAVETILPSYLDRYRRGGWKRSEGAGP